MNLFEAFQELDNNKIIIRDGWSSTFYVEYEKKDMKDLRIRSLYLSPEGIRLELSDYEANDYKLIPLNEWEKQEKAIYRRAKYIRKLGENYTSEYTNSSAYTKWFGDNFNKPVYVLMGHFKIDNNFKVKVIFNPECTDYYMNISDNKFLTPAHLNQFLDIKKNIDELCEKLKQM